MPLFPVSISLEERIRTRRQSDRRIRRRLRCKHARIATRCTQCKPMQRVTATALAELQATLEESTK